MKLSLPRKLTPPEVAKSYGVSPESVIAWVKAGELRAIDVARKGAKRPRYRIDPADLIAFENRRLAVPETPRPKRRRKKDTDVIEYF